MKPQKHLQNEKGIAMIEAIPVLVVFVILTAYGFGFFGIIHSAILNSMAARNYAFETFRHRTNLVAFRTNVNSTNHYRDIGTRVHVVISEATPPNPAPPGFATERPIAMGLGNVPGNDGSRTSSVHMQQVIGQDLSRRSTVGVAPVWLQIGYGICLNDQCGD